MSKKLKRHKLWGNVNNGSWPLCWIRQGMVKINQDYKLTRREEEVECKNCLKYMKVMR